MPASTTYCGIVVIPANSPVYALETNMLVNIAQHRMIVSGRRPNLRKFKMIRWSFYLHYELLHEIYRLKHRNRPHVKPRGRDTDGGVLWI